MLQINLAGEHFSVLLKKPLRKVFKLQKQCLLYV